MLLGILGEGKESLADVLARAGGPVSVSTMPTYQFLAPRQIVLLGCEDEANRLKSYGGRIIRLGRCPDNDRTITATAPAEIELLAYQICKEWGFIQ